MLKVLCVLCAGVGLVLVVVGMISLWIFMGSLFTESFHVLY